MKNGFLILRKNKMKTIFFSLAICHLIFCQSCMKMRMTSKETKTFFTESKTEYSDSSLEIDGFTIHYIETGNKNANRPAGSLQQRSVYEKRIR